MQGLYQLLIIVLRGISRMGVRGGGIPKRKSLVIRYWVAPSVLKISLYLVASGSIENNFNAKINNTLHKFAILISIVIDNNRA